MKTFNSAVVAFLAFTAYTIFQHTAQESGFSTRLRNIAHEVNNSNLGWKAEEPSRFQDLEINQAKKLMGTFLEEPSMPH